MINYKIVSKTPPSSPTFRLHKTSKFINSAKNIITYPTTYPTTYCIQSKTPPPTPIKYQYKPSTFKESKGLFLFFAKRDM